MCLLNVIFFLLYVKCKPHLEHFSFCFSKYQHHFWGSTPGTEQCIIENVITVYCYIY